MEEESDEVLWGRVLAGETRSYGLIWDRHRDRVFRHVPGAVPVAVLWRHRTWRCPDGGCPVGVFVEQHPALVPARGSLTCRAVTWAIGQLRREHATIEGLSRQLGTTWKTLWRAVAPRLVDGP